MTTLEIILAVIFGLIVIAIGATLIGRRKSETQPKSLLYTQALNHILQKEDNKAIRELKAIIEKDTNHIDAYIKLGYVLRRTGQIKPAVKVHQALLYRQDIDKLQKLEIMRNLVLDYIEMGEKGLALSVALNILDVDKKNIWALEKIWHLYRDLKKWNKALEYMEKVFQIRKEVNKRAMSIYKVQEGLEKFNAGNYHEARLLLRKAMKLDPLCEAGYYYMAESYLKEKRDAEAVEWWEKFADVAPKKAWLIYPQLQKVLFNYGNFGKIEEFYLKILKKVPHDARTITELSGFYERKGNLSKALDLVSDLMVTNPDSLIAKIAYSKILIAMERNREAGDILADILNHLDTIRDVRCSHCGHLADQPLWICPECGAVDTFLN